jgi:hypothetical protein
MAAFYLFVYDAVGIVRGTMAGAEGSLWPVVVGGVFTLAGTLAATVTTIVRENVQQKRDAKKRRADTPSWTCCAIIDVKQRT